MNERIEPGTGDQETKKVRAKKAPRPHQLGMRALCRPAYIEGDHFALDTEFRNAHFVYHRLLDFEDLHQAKLDAAAELAAPGILRVGRILSRLNRRKKWRERVLDATKEGKEPPWTPKPRPALLKALKAKKEELRKVRNADAGWKAAIAWATEPGELDLPKGKFRRQAGETDEAMAKRTEGKSPVRNRREEWQHRLYEEHVAKGAKGERRIYWGTWNALLKSRDQARASVLKARAEGLSAKWARPRLDRGGTIATDKLKVIKMGKPFWWFEMQLADKGRVRFRAKAGNWHNLEGARLRSAKLTRKKRGLRWTYSVSIAVEGATSLKRGEFATSRVIAFDWGHREFGHPNAALGMRAFVWVADDGERGEILLPKICRELKDQADELQRHLDLSFDARKATLGLDERKRHKYLRALMRKGVRTAEEDLWIQWHVSREIRLQNLKTRLQNIRKETYLQAIRDLRKHYKFFVFEDEKNEDIKELQKDEMMERRKRANRDMTARYMFTCWCESLGGKKVPVSARNTTRECPSCGHIGKNGPELIIACPACGVVRDKDYGAAEVILRRGQKVLAEWAAKSGDL